QSGDHGSTYQGEVSVLGRLDIVRITAVSLSCCAGAPTLMWHCLLRHAHLLCTSSAFPWLSLPTAITLRPAHDWRGRRVCPPAARCSAWHGRPRERCYGIAG